MKQSISLCLSLACSALAAQTPSSNLMPDGSRDAYVGLGISSRPVYEGANDRRTDAVPAVQVDWSNGVFIAGSTVGWHVSDQPRLEYGPLVSLQTGRSEAGTRTGLDPVDLTNTAGSVTTPPTGLLPGSVPSLPPGSTRLSGMQGIDPHLELGGFVNFYLTPQLRMTTSLLNGGANQRSAWRGSVDIQHVFRPAAPHHSFSVSTGVSLVNNDYNQAYFGVTAAQALSGYNRQYSPAGGVKDVHLDLRWKWFLTPSWLLVSTVRASRLLGDAATSPLVDNVDQLTLTSGLAYRF
jgi:outer membrane protein